MMDYIRANTPKEIGGYKVDKVIDYINGYEDIPAQNAIRFFFDNNSWMAVRPSGTEPKIKFYFYTKQDSREKAINVAKEIKEGILDIVNKVE